MDVRPCWVASLYTCLACYLVIPRTRAFSTAEDTAEIYGNFSTCFFRAIRINFYRERLISPLSLVRHETFMEPQIAINILHRVFTFLLHHKLPRRSRLYPFRSSSTTQVACWISVLPFRPIESQNRPSSMFSCSAFSCYQKPFLVCRAVP